MLSSAAASIKHLEGVGLWLLHKERQQAWRGRVCAGGALQQADGIFDDDAHLVRVTVMRHMSLIILYI